MSKALENMSYEQLLEVNKQLESKLSDTESRLAELQFQIDQMNRLLYGSKRERFIKNTDENQMTLPFDVEEEPQPEKQQETITYVRTKTKRVNHPGRMALPSHLPVEEIVIEPEEDTTEMKCIGREITDQLELVPAKLFIKRYIRPKYIKPEDEETLTHKGVIAPLPVFPIEKGIAGPGLLAQIMIDKFVDHLPIYRQIERFKREGIKIPSSTLNGWQESVSNLLWPLYENLKRTGYCSKAICRLMKHQSRCLIKRKKEKPIADTTGFILHRWRKPYYSIISMAARVKGLLNY